MHSKKNKSLFASHDDKEVIQEAWSYAKSVFDKEKIILTGVLEAHSSAGSYYTFYIMLESETYRIFRLEGEEYKDFSSELVKKVKEFKKYLSERRIKFVDRISE